jgi:hypothetical protein
MVATVATTVALMISGTVPEKPVTIKNNVVTITQTTTLKAKIVGNKIIVVSKL